MIFNACLKKVRNHNALKIEIYLLYILITKYSI